MTASFKIALASIVAGCLYFLFVTKNILNSLPGFHCEGFGCMGNGIFNLLLGASIPLIFAIWGALKAPTGLKARQATLCFAISAAVIGLTLLSIYFLNERRNAQGFAEACKDHPELCPPAPQSQP